MNTHTKFNRQAILDNYIDRILDDMTTKDLMRIVGDYLEDNFSEYTDAQLITEIEDNYPELLVGLDAPN
jgi:hypothetical protein